MSTVCGQKLKILYYLAICCNITAIRIINYSEPWMLYRAYCLFATIYITQNHLVLEAAIQWSSHFMKSDHLFAWASLLWRIQVCFTWTEIQKSTPKHSSLYSLKIWQHSKVISWKSWQLYEGMKTNMTHHWWWR